MTETEVIAMLQRSPVPEHMHHAVIDYLVHKIGPGSFLCAVLANNFVDACGTADDINIRKLHQWATFLYWELPSPRATGSPWGSYAAVEAWVAA